jgi:hypothetical protein
MRLPRFFGVHADMQINKRCASLSKKHKSTGCVDETQKFEKQQRKEDKTQAVH